MIFLAWRQMRARQKQTFLILLGISFGTMVYVIIAGLQLGMRSFIIEQLLNNTSHIRITGEEKFIESQRVRSRLFHSHELIQWFTPPHGKRDDVRLENPHGWYEFLNQHPEVTAWAPRFSVDAIAAKGPSKVAMMLMGVIPEKQEKTSEIAKYVRTGKLSDLMGGGNRIILGKELLKHLGAQVGQTVLLTIGTGSPRPFKIVGVLSLGNQEADLRMALAHIIDVQKLNRTPGRISEISVALRNLDEADRIAEEWKNLGRDKVEGWQEANANFMQVIMIQDYVRYIITGAILLVGSFGVYNVLSIMIAQKQKEIAILRSMGFGPPKIMQLFMFQGLILGSIGAVLGLLLGTGINLFIESIELGFEIGTSNHLIVSYGPEIFITAFLAALGASAIASFIPARHASRLTPLEIIRANL
jgi:lipoprotein-releasing system permease protein